MVTQSKAERLAAITAARTPEQRQAIMAKARAAQQEHRASAKLELMGESDFEAVDRDRWFRLAYDRRLRLPEWSARVTLRQMESWLHRLGIEGKSYYDWSGYTALAAWPKANPTWPLRAFVGLLLEAKDEVAL